MSRLTPFLVGLLALVLTPASLSAQTEEVEAWVRSVIERSEQFPPLPGYSISWREELTYVPPPEELARIRREIEGKPDHPLRFELGVYERRLRHGPDVSGIRFFAKDTEYWRCNETREYLENYWDRTVTPRVVWSLTDEQLAVMDPTYQIPSGRDYGKGLPGLRSWLGDFFYGGLQILPLAESWSIRSTTEADSYVLEAAFASGGVHEYVIRRHAAGGMFIVESRTLTLSPDRPEAVGTRREFQQWRYHDLHDLWIAERVVHRRPDGASERVHIFDSFDPVSSRELQRLFAVPDVHMGDVLRGDLTLTSIYDYRPQVKTITRATPEGLAVERMAVPRQRSASWWRGAGWVTLTVLIVLFAALWLRNRSGGA